MMNSTVLDVVVGLTFVFVMLSVAVSLLNERIQSVLDKRAAMLEAALRKLLGDEEAGGDGASLFRKVTEHALVRAMAPSPARMPSYLSSSTFALALFDALVPADGEHPLTFKRLREAIAQLPESSGRTALLALMNSAEYDLPTARASVERWFDSAMERLSGVYKRHINVWIFVLGFGLAAATNADSILLVQRLEHEGALRAAVVAKAAQVDTTNHDLKLDRAEADKLDLLFWDTEHLVSADEMSRYPRAARQPELNLSWIRWLWFKIIGFLMTAMAVSLGAPFWFDLLGRLVNLRATGAKPVPAPPAVPVATPTPDA